MYIYVDDNITEMQDGPSLETYEKLVVNCCPCCTCVCSVSRPCQFASIFYKYIDMGKISIHWSKLLKQGYSSQKLQTTVRKFDGRHTDLPCSQIGHFCVTYVEGFVRKL